MKLNPVIFLLLILPAAAPSGLAEMKTYPSKSHDISGYKTYTWLPPRMFTRTEIRDNDPVFAPLIRAAVDRQLISKGYREVPAGGDIQVVAAGVVTISSQLEAFLVQFGFNNGDLYNTIGVTTVTPVTRVNREGVLAVGLYDPKLKASLWSGYISKALGRPTNNPGPQIDAAAAKLLGKLPKSK